MLTGFVALSVDSPLVKLKLYGLIADRLFILKTINVNGKSFINAIANQYGGLGVMIVQPQSLAIARFGIIMTTL
jgi:hypothetical protein